jgi:hypothetical protein
MIYVYSENHMKHMNIHCVGKNAELINVNCRWYIQVLLCFDGQCIHAGDWKNFQSLPADNPDFIDLMSDFIIEICYHSVLMSL